MDFPQDITYRYQLPGQLRFSDVDSFGHVNNTVYFTLFDTSKTRYLMDVLGADIFSRMGIVMAHTEARFIAPVYYPDEIVIQTALTHIGTKSFVLCQRAVNVRTQEVKCECKTVMVAYDYQQHCTIAVPTEVREKIAAFEQNPNLLKNVCI